MAPLSLLPPPRPLAPRLLSPPPSTYDAAAPDPVERLLRSALAATDPRRAGELRNQAVLRSLDLADALAHRLLGRGIDGDDLIQVARMALVKAACRYRPERGPAFAPYATATISGELKRHFRDFGWWVRPPRRLQELRADLVREEERLRHSLFRSPGLVDLAAAVGRDRDEVREAIGCATAYRPDSLEAPHPLGASLGERVVADGDVFGTIDVRAALGQALDLLSKRERRLLQLRFVDELSQSAIGEELGISQMQVSRLLASILQRLRAGLNDDAASA